MKLFTKRSGVTINLSTEAVLRTIFLVVVTLFLLRIVGRVGHQLELFGVAGFLALALNPAVAALSKRLHIQSRVRATGLAYLIIVALLAGFLTLVVPPLVKQTNAFVHTIPHTISNLQNAHSAPGRIVQRYNLQPQIDKISKNLTNKAGDAPAIVFTTAGRVGSGLVAVLTVLVLTFMMLVEGPLWLDRVWAITPQEKRKEYKVLVAKMYKVITGYVNGQVLIAAIASVFAFAALTIGAHFTHATINAIALAGIVFLFGLIPLIGNTIAAVIVILVCLFSSTPLALVMLVYFPIYQQTENATLAPHIQAKSNQLTPLLVFMAALLGAGFGGLLGAFVAIPAAGCLRILLEYKFGDSLLPTTSAIKESKE